jgi:hypothetical protein
MNRRAFVAGLGAVLAAPLSAEAQQSSKLYRVGVLIGASEAFVAPYVEIFRPAPSEQPPHLPKIVPGNR